MTSRRKTLLQLGLFAGVAIMLSGCYAHYPGYSYAPRPYYAAPHDYGHGYRSGYDRHGHGKFGRHHYRRERHGQRY